MYKNAGLIKRSKPLVNRRGPFFPYSVYSKTVFVAHSSWIYGRKKHHAEKTIQLFHDAFPSVIRFIRFVNAVFCHWCTAHWQLLWMKILVAISEIFLSITAVNFKWMQLLYQIECNVCLCFDWTKRDLFCELQQNNKIIKMIFKINEKGGCVSRK